MAEGCRGKEGGPATAAPAAGLWVGWKGQRRAGCCCQAVRALGFAVEGWRGGDPGLPGCHHGLPCLPEYLCKHAVPCLLGITALRAAQQLREPLLSRLFSPERPHSPRVPEELGVRGGPSMTSAPSSQQPAHRARRAAWKRKASSWLQRRAGGLRPRDSRGPGAREGRAAV